MCGIWTREKKREEGGKVSTKQFVARWRGEQNSGIDNGGPFTGKSFD